VMLEPYSAMDFIYRDLEWKWSAGLPVGYDINNSRLTRWV